MRLLATIVLLAASVLAQQPAPAPGPPVDSSNYETAIIPVKTLTGDSFQRLSRVLSIFGAKFYADEKLRTIVVFAPKDVIAHMRKVIESLDRPGSDAAIGRNIQMTLTLLRCSAKPFEGAKSLPADMEPVAKQLRASSLCKDVQLWDTIPLRLTEGRRTENNTRLPGNLMNRPNAFSTLNLRIYPEVVKARSDGRYVQLEEIRISLRIPFLTSQSHEPPQFQYNDFSINTSGEFKEGQKSVIGKTSGGDEDSSVFAVIEIKILD